MSDRPKSVSLLELDEQKTVSEKLKIFQNGINPTNGREAFGTSRAGSSQGNSSNNLNRASLEELKKKFAVSGTLAQLLSDSNQNPEIPRSEQEDNGSKPESLEEIQISFPQGRGVENIQCTSKTRLARERSIRLQKNFLPDMQNKDQKSPSSNMTTGPVKSILMTASKKDLIPGNRSNQESSPNQISTGPVKVPRNIKDQESSPLKMAGDQMTTGPVKVPPITAVRNNLMSEKTKDQESSSSSMASHQMTTGPVKVLPIIAVRNNLMSEKKKHQEFPSSNMAGHQMTTSPVKVLPINSVKNNLMSEKPNDQESSTSKMARLMMTTGPVKVFPVISMRNNLMSEKKKDQEFPSSNMVFHQMTTSPVKALPINNLMSEKTKDQKSSTGDQVKISPVKGQLSHFADYSGPVPKKTFLVNPGRKGLILGKSNNQEPPVPNQITTGPVKVLMSAPTNNNNRKSSNPASVRRTTASSIDAMKHNGIPGRNKKETSASTQTMDIQLSSSPVKGLVSHFEENGGLALKKTLRPVPGKQNLPVIEDRPIEIDENLSRDSRKSWNSNEESYLELDEFCRSSLENFLDEPCAELAAGEVGGRDSLFLDSGGQRITLRKPYAGTTQLGQPINGEFASYCAMRKKVQENHNGGKTAATANGLKPSNNIQIKRWKDLPEVTSSGVLSALTAKQICLHESLYEMVTSQASYACNLNILDRFYYNKLSNADKQTMPVDELKHLFLYVKPIVKAGNELFTEWNNLFKNNVLLPTICDSMMSHYNTYREDYLKFFLHTKKAVQVYGSLMNENPRFKMLIGKLMEVKESNGLALDSYMNHPLQRITKLPLMLKQVVEHAELGDGLSYYQKALNFLEKFVDECNSEAGRLSGYEDILLLESKMVFADRVPTIFIAKKNRYLVTESKGKCLSSNSRMFKKKEKIQLILFNDLLLICVKAGDKLMIRDYCFTNDVVINSTISDVLKITLNNNNAGSVTILEVSLETSHDKFTSHLYCSPPLTPVPVLPSARPLRPAQMRVEIPKMPPKTTPESIGSYRRLRNSVVEEPTVWPSIEPKTAEIPKYIGIEYREDLYIVCTVRFEASRDSDLDLEVGDIVYVHKKREENSICWYYGERFVDERQGWFDSRTGAVIESPRIRKTYDNLKTARIITIQYLDLTYEESEA